MRGLLVMVLLGQLAIAPDAIQKDTVRVEKDGVKQYEIRKDVLVPGEYNVYDRDGLKGTLKRDVLFPDRYRIELNSNE